MSPEDELSIAFIAGAAWASHRPRSHDEMRSFSDEYARVHVAKAIERGVTITVTSYLAEVDDILQSKR